MVGQSLGIATHPSGRAYLLCAVAAAFPSKFPAHSTTYRRSAPSATVTNSSAGAPDGPQPALAFLPVGPVMISRRHVGPTGKLSPTRSPPRGRPRASWSISDSRPEALNCPRPQRPRPALRQHPLSYQLSFLGNARQPLPTSPTTRTWWPPCGPPSPSYAGRPARSSSLSFSWSSAPSLRTPGWSSGPQAVSSPPTARLSLEPRARSGAALHLWIQSLLVHGQSALSELWCWPPEQCRFL